MQIVVALTLFIFLILLLLNRVRAVYLFTSLVFVYYLLDYISLDKMLGNITNSSLVTLVLLIIYSFIFEKSTFISFLSNRLFSKSYKNSLLKMTFFTSFLSAFLNNTAVVSSMISIIKENRFHLPSKLLLPLSYASILGGTMTLIGTSTNLIINGFVEELGLPTLNIFDFLYVGLPLVILGNFAVLYVSKYLPKNDEKRDSMEEYFLEAKVIDGSKLIGKSIKENSLRNLEYLYLSEIIREDIKITPVNPNEIIKEGDILVFSGDVSQVEILSRFDGLLLEHQKHNSKNLIEVIISNESTLINKKIKESNFRTKFDASIVAVKRANERLSKKIGEITLQMGDNLILAVGKDFDSRDNLKNNFHILGGLDINRKLNSFQSSLVLLGFLFAIVLNLLGILSFIKSLMFLIVVFIYFDFISVSEIRRRFPFELVLIIASAFGIADVMIESEIALLITNFINSIFSPFGVYGSFIAIYLMTFILTELITNSAAASLVFPIAYMSAKSLGVDPMPFIMAVAYGASASFMTPYGYQTNLMVASVGGYDMKLFLKSGKIVSLLYFSVAITLIPLFFPF